MKFKDVEVGTVVKFDGMEAEKVKRFVRKGSPYNIVSNDGEKNVFGFLVDSKEVELKNGL